MTTSSTPSTATPGARLAASVVQAVIDRRDPLAVTANASPDVLASALVAACALLYGDAVEEGDDPSELVDDLLGLGTPSA
jgi:hypothetical protein